MAKKNFKEFVKEHKKEIIIGTIAGVTGVVAGYMLNEFIISPLYVRKFMAEVNEKPTKVLTPYKSHFGDCSELWIGGVTGNPTAIIRDINYQNFEEAGFEFVDYCLDNGITKTLDQPINVMIEIVNN